ncbi:hypothetical protein Nepgr_014135 [Nepenthes gracilis]|uniref:Uncharacterized protein n=1 Tax=Nepenthes gracilis TaxID=150966 RepID=A0AAD3SKD9_NEPGR|nr:hypothetical protein Nepgr_014135 [Nepenthes gracilis]
MCKCEERENVKREKGFGCHFWCSEGREIGLLGRHSLLFKGRRWEKSGLVTVACGLVGALRSSTALEEIGGNSLWLVRSYQNDRRVVGSDRNGRVRRSSSGRRRLVVAGSTAVG